MSMEELDAIAAEIPASDPETDALESDAPETDAPEPVAIGDKIDAAQLAPIIAGVVGELGNMICRRAKVELLTHDEVARLSGAAAEVAAQYDLILTPKTAAWLGLGLVSYSIYLPRLKMVQERQGVPPKDEPGKADPEAPGQNVIQLQAEIDARNAAETA